ncbi:hypothetical protein O181_033579 [Austropuccinia psidii MF-1]|uniref:Reverse transcriptase Ty1/copia-type domain-containing protein n=1 Tax=Austropuccinia psidii MF-1 TaxID=1389203 RepID=A0A9Q3CZF5_9BASI|nr:hypothetical protein [Austropuccinia psidii MF-1]
MLPLMKQFDSESPLLVPSVTQGTQTVDEICPSLSEVVDQVHPDLSCDLPIVAPPQEGQDAVLDKVQHPSLEEEARPCQRIRVIGPQHPTLVSCDINPKNILPFTRKPLTLVTSNSVAPRTFKSAFSSLEKDLLLDAIKKELESMNLLGIWDVVKINPSFRLVGTTWVFKVKKDHLGHITKYKARLCAQGFTESAGVDFNQTYAPTSFLNSLRTLIAFEAAKTLEFHQIDIKGVFLNALLFETVYLGIPQGFNINKR